jgi:formylmethanofuran dehydrogenase subunit E
VAHDGQAEESPPHDPRFTIDEDSVFVEIGRYTFEEFIKVVESFHGYQSPGVILGGIMVSYAMEQLPGGVLFDAISETAPCLPDAIQLLTPCTFGNGWLKVINLGRFALSLYEKHGGKGVRVFVDPAKLDGRKEIRNWLFKLLPKSEQDQNRLIAEIGQAGRSVLGLSHIQLKAEHLGKTKRGSIVECTMCGEPYPQRDGPVCLACQGQSPYA